MEKLSNFTIQCQQYLLDKEQPDSELLDIQINQSNVGSQNNEYQANGEYLFVIDKSGSMGGQYINNTKLMIEQIIVYLLGNSNKDLRLSLIMFNNQIEKHFDLQTKSKSEITNLIKNIQASGGTKFTLIFNQIAQYILESQSQSFKLFFLTDGEIQDDEDQSQNHKYLNQARDNIQKSVIAKKCNLEVHALGIGKSHNPIILDNLISLKTGKQGTYQFIKQPEDIQPSFEAIKEIISQDDIRFKIQILSDKTYEFDLPAQKIENLEQDPQEAKQLEEQKSDAHLKDKNTQFLSILPKYDILKQTGLPSQNVNLKELLMNGKISLAVMKNQQLSGIYKVQYTELTIDPQEEKQIQLQSEIFLLKNQQEVFQQDFKKFINEIQQKSNVNQQEVGKFENQNNEIKQQFQVILKKLFKHKNSSRKNYLVNQLQLIGNSLEKTSELIHQLYKSNITNELVGDVNALAYSNIQSIAFKKKLEKRYKASNLQYEEYQKQIQSISQYYKENKDNIEKECKQDLEKYGTCFLTCYNFLEAIMEQDCLCFTFSVTRSELSIVRPECLKIVQIFPTIISAKSFMQAVQYALKLSPENSGGFQKKEGQIIKGIAQEYINAALPIFINPHHWKVAKFLLQPILGWVATLDPMGYHHSQKRTIPFSLLAKVTDELFKNPQSEFLNQYYESIKQTCLEIIKDEEFDQNQIKVEQSQAKSFREELVKQFNDVNTYGISKIDIDSIPNINIFTAKVNLALELKWIQFENQKQMQLFYQKVIEERLRRKITDIPQTAQLILLAKTNDNNDISKKFLLEQDKLIKDKCCLQLLSYFENQKLSVKQVQQLFSEKSVLEILNFDNIQGFKCLYIQNCLQKEEKVRKNAILAKEYCDPWTEYKKFFDQLKKLQADESNVSQVIAHYQKMNVKKKQYIQGTISFQLPHSAQEYQYLQSALISSTDMNSVSDIIDSLSKYKKNTRWYFFTLLGANDPLMSEKLSIIISKLGPITGIKDYHIYLLTKADRNDILSQITPNKKSKSQKKTQ